METTPHPLVARKAKGINQVELAAAVGCAQITVMRAETSGRYPRSIALRRAYLAALGLPANAQDPIPAASIA